MVIDSAFWSGRRVLLTGHTGFKGAWLALMLARLNARCTGFALAPPTEPNLFTLAGVGGDVHDLRGDIRDLSAVKAAFAEADPEILIHMAAQPLVRRAYADPVETYQTNVMGLVHVLEAARGAPNLKVAINVTTDKCYENREWIWGYRENDALGGRDPYANSKACAELATAAYRASFFQDGAVLATARAGNVIGGGDFAEDRIAPDAMRAFMSGDALPVRNPRAVRPWQHVLDPLAGYLLLAQNAFRGGAAFGEGWNFGPGPESERTVESLLEKFAAAWGDGAAWRPDGGRHPHEAGLLRLDAAKAAQKLDWRPLLDFDAMTEWTVAWYRAYARGADMRAATFGQVDAYLGQRVRLVSPFRDLEDNRTAEARDATQRIA